MFTKLFLNQPICNYQAYEQLQAAEDSWREIYIAIDNNEEENEIQKESDSAEVDKTKALEQELDEVKELLTTTRQLADNNLNKLKYMAADFDNYRKQIDRQMNTRIESNRAELLSRFLNVYDDFSRALEMAEQCNSDPMVIEGLQGINKNLKHLLEAEQVREIEAVDTPFDPNIHDAISFSYRDDLPESTVTKEIRKGYMINGKILRPSLVEVSKKIIKNIDNDTENIEKVSE
ncbi:MAG TPA: nucleotide exchange factor GrpE [Nitrososphaeraceae archaeon]